MKQLLFLLLAMSASSSGWSQFDPSQEPPIEADEDVSNFKKGFGGAPKNGHSKFVKGVKMRPPVLGGNGCPQGTVSAALTDDNKTLSILFDDYIAQAGKPFRVARDVKACTLNIPIEVPAGSQFAVVKLDYSGYNFIPKNGRTRYVTIYSVVDGSNKKSSRRIRRRFDFAGPLDESYILSADISIKPLWSPCGKSVNFRVETRAVAVTNNKGDEVTATIDSIDGSVAEGNVEYHLLWQECRGELPVKKPDPKPEKKPFKKPSFPPGFHSHT